MRYGLGLTDVFDHNDNAYNRVWQFTIGFPIDFSSDEDFLEL
ncbi:hypothetical protein [Pseudochryseolinea flava]|nr:hypothetical protein [Pseudochryseolinea flava]